MHQAIPRRSPDQLYAFRSGAYCLALRFVASNLKKERNEDYCMPQEMHLFSMVREGAREKNEHSSRYVA